MSSTPTPIEVTLPTGEVIKAADAQEALKIAIKMTNDTKEAYHNEKKERENLAAQVAALSAEVQRQNTPPPAPGSFDKDKYFKLLNEDPVLAQNMLDAHRFGLNDPAQVPAVFNSMRSGIDEIQGNFIAGQFLNNHAEDFPAGPESAKALRERVESLNRSGHPASIDTVELAYKQLVDAGTIKPLVTKEEEENDAPPPSFAGGGSAQISENEMRKAENMSTQELEAFLKSKGMIQ